MNNRVKESWVTFFSFIVFHLPLSNPPDPLFSHRLGIHKIFINPDPRSRIPNPLNAYHVFNSTTGISVSFEPSLCSLCLER